MKKMIYLLSIFLYFTAQGKYISFDEIINPNLQIYSLNNPLNKWNEQISKKAIKIKSEPANYNFNNKYKNKFSSLQTFKITHPNGGENFGIGTDTIITWEGCKSEDKVTLEYSTDNGATYNPITNSGTGYKYIWKNIPNNVSNNCLLKGSINPDPNLPKNLVLGLGDLKQVVYSPDGTKFASCGNRGIFIWDKISGDTILSIQGNTGNVICIAFSPDGRLILSGSSDRKIRL